MSAERTAVNARMNYRIQLPSVTRDQWLAAIRKRHPKWAEQTAEESCGMGGERARRARADGCKLGVRLDSVGVAQGV